MSADVAERVEVGCYDLQGPDFETLMLGAVTPSLVDADRIVREGRNGDAGWRNGFPNWAMYRTALAGDSHMASNLLAWCLAFGAVHVTENTRSDEAVGFCAGRDAFVWLTTKRWGANAEELAKALGVSPKTYRQIRATVAARLKVSMEEYWVRLGIGMREVALAERRQETTPGPARVSDGRGFDRERPILGDGNLRAFPRGSGC